MVRCLAISCIVLLSGSAMAQAVSYETVFADSNYSFRALSVADDSIAWIGGTKGRIGHTVDGGKNWEITTVKGFEKSDFRTVYAFDKNNAVIANAGSPASILRTNDRGITWKTVYTNENKNAFFDGIDFWDGKSGLIYGDPIDGKLLVLETHDAGMTWKEITNEPMVEEGEASFAASGTNIRCIGHNAVYIATGGKKSRIYYSFGMFFSWQKIEVPVLQGKDSQGIFSIAFYDVKKSLLHGQTGIRLIAVGGDYTNETYAQHHVFYRQKKSGWKTPQPATGGYRECVEFISGKQVIAVGPLGSDFSVDAGQTWKPVSLEKGLHVVRKARKGNLVLAAGKGKIIKIIWAD